MSHFLLTQIKGIIPALVTPFDEHANVDIPKLQRIVEYLIEKGVGGFYVTGSTGEGFLQSSEQRMQTAQAVVAQVDHRVGVIVHVGGISTDESIKLAVHANKIGADAISAVPPFYYKFSFEQIAHHYRDLAASSRIPLVIYSIANTGVSISPDEVASLAAIPNIGGIKLTSTDLYQMQRIREKTVPRFMIYSGCDEMILPASLMGADGYIGSTYNLMPELYTKLLCSAQQNWQGKTQQLAILANDVIEIFHRHNYTLSLKEMLKQIGLDCGDNRRPFYPMSGEERETLVEELKALKSLRSDFDLSGIALFEHL